MIADDLLIRSCCGWLPQAIVSDAVGKGQLPAATVSLQVHYISRKGNIFTLPCVIHRYALNDLLILTFIPSFH